MSRLYSNLKSTVEIQLDFCLKIRNLMLPILGVKINLET